MRSLLLAAVAAVASGSPVPPPPKAPEPPRPAAEEKAPCKEQRGLLRPEKPSDAQRFVPGLF